MSDNMNMRVRSHFATRHLIAGSLFANYAKAFDTDGSPAAALRNVRIARTEEYLSYVTGAVILSAAGVEAFTNDVFIEATDVTDPAYSPVPTEVCDALSTFWPAVQRAGAPQKLQVIMECTKARLDASAAEVIADVRDLCALRNALIHYKAEWEDTQGVHRSLEERLAGKFAESPYSNKEQAFIPHRCLGAACARWAVEVAFRAIEVTSNCLGDPFALKSESVRVRASSSS